MPEIPMYEPLFDIRVIAKSPKMASGSETLNLETIGKITSSTGKSTARLLDAALTHIPALVWAALNMIVVRLARIALIAKR